MLRHNKYTITLLIYPRLLRMYIKRNIRTNNPWQVSIGLCTYNPITSVVLHVLHTLYTWDVQPTQNYM